MAHKRSRIVIPCRFAYLNCWKPSTLYGNNKYSMTALISKDDQETIDRIYDAIDYVKEHSLNKWGGRVPSNLKLPLHDGDEEKPGNKSFKNCYFINAKSDSKPQIVDKEVQPISDSTQVYSGCYGNVSLIFFAYNCSGNKGISVILGNIQKVKDGNPIGGKISASDEFVAINSTRYEDKGGRYGDD